MIINSKHWPNVITFGDCKWHPGCNISWMVDRPRTFEIRNYDDTDYWYINMLGGDVFYHFPLSTLMSVHEIDRVKKREVVIVVCNYSEAYHSIVDGIYKYLIIENNIPPEQVLLLSNSPDIVTEINHISNKYNIEPIKAEWLNTYEWDGTVYTNFKPHEIPNTALATLNRTSYSKKFLSFNGQPRAHRIIFMGLMCAYDLIPLGHISYNCYVFGNRIENLPSSEDYYHNPMLVLTQNNSEVTQILTENKDKICQLQSMFLDTTVDNQASRGSLHDTCKDYYEDTYFSVVTETLCMKGESSDGESGFGRILSEKTFKAIINRHPFIILGVAKSLQLLKDLGYKTFSPWINEDYDNELDDITRIHMVVKEVKKLSELPDDKLAEFLIFAKEITNYNFNNLKYKGPPKTLPLPLDNVSSEQYTIFLPSSANWVKPAFKLFQESTFTEPYSAYFGKPHTSIIGWGGAMEYNKYMPKIINHLQSDPTSILILHYDWCPLLPSHTVNMVSKFIIEHNINPDQLYFIIMDYLQIPDITQLFAEKNIKIHIVGHNQLLINETIEYTGPVVESTKLFSIFSRSTREWRFHFFCDLIGNGLLDKCIYSYINASPYIVGEHPTELEDIKKMIPFKYKILPNTRKKISDWVDGMPYAIEKDINNYHAPSLFDAINQSSIHIVLETMHIGNVIHLTEKTWKAISVKKPFMIYGVPGCLNWLHRHGYKTFHPLINEDYDIIQDPIIRKHAIINEMKRIAALSEVELNILLQQCQSIVEHNHQLFLQERNFKWPLEFRLNSVF